MVGWTIRIDGLGNVTKKRVKVGREWDINGAKRLSVKIDLTKEGLCKQIVTQAFSIM